VLVDCYFFTYRFKDIGVAGPKARPPTSAP